MDSKEPLCGVKSNPGKCLKETFAWIIYFGLNVTLSS
ncbi:hypothetical protein BGP_6210 [Beggiatoa sp. PS]|nr:hypothetical protein BGP_6210 [Beggiatoa sp. PS]